MLTSQSGRVVPLWQRFIIDDFQFGLQFFTEFLADLVGSTDDIDGGSKTGSCAGLTHQIDNGFKRIKQAARACATDMREEATFDWVVLATVAR